MDDARIAAVRKRAKEILSEKASPQEPFPLPRSPAEIARKIDHTLLKPDATPAEIDRLCDEALNFRFAACCVNPAHLAQVVRRLRGSEVKPISVAGFPLGASTAETKAFEAAEGVRRGAEEIDMVIHVGALKAGNDREVFDDIRKVVAAAAPKPVKVILEMGLLTTEEKIVGCLLAEMAGAAFVKTSTGFGHGGATVEDVALMRRVVRKETQVKASGGIRTVEDAVRMIEAGADRIGTSSGVSIAEGKKGTGAY